MAEKKKPARYVVTALVGPFAAGQKVSEDELREAGLDPHHLIRLGQLDGAPTEETPPPGPVLDLPPGEEK